MLFTTSEVLFSAVRNFRGGGGEFSGEVPFVDVDPLEQYKGGTL